MQKPQVSDGTSSADIRPTLLRVMTDLYVRKAEHTPQEEKHYTDLALRLIELVDAKTRIAVAGMIGGYPNAPVLVRQRLLRELIEVREPTPPPEPKPDNPIDDLSELFLGAEAEERRLILLNLPFAPGPAAAKPDKQTAQESSARLEAAVLARNADAFAKELSAVLGLDRGFARRLYDDPSGEPVVVIAVALGMPSTVLQRILLCLRPSVSQSVQRVYELALLQEEIETDAALRLIAIWRASHPLVIAPPARPATPTTERAEEPARRRGLAAFSVARPRIRWDDHALAWPAENG